MNIALVDDRPEEREKSKLILSEYAAVHRARVDVSSFSSGEALLKAYKPFQYTAILLDIYMDGMSGIDAARAIREQDRDARIVFLTSSEDHMPDAFRLHAFECIVKPVSRDKIFPALDDMMGSASSVSEPRFFFSSQRSDQSVAYRDLVMVGTDAHNYLEVTDQTGKTQKTRMTFAEASATLLEDKRFLTLRRGVIVNMNFIRRFDDALCFLTVGVPIPISPRCRKSLEQRWDNYLINRMQPGGEEAWHEHGSVGD